MSDTPVLVGPVLVGEEIEVKLNLKAPSGAPVAGATGVAIKAKPPGGGAVRSYATTAGDQPGQWVALIFFDLAGRWWVSGECSGPTKAVREMVVEVTPRAVA